MVAQPIQKSSPETKWNILIIDDDEDDYLIAREMLTEAKGRKFDVHWAASFEAGQKELAAHPYHAILVDYDLGPRTGIDLIREANEQGIASPLILFTGRGTYETDVEAMQAGATMYLTKGEVNPLLLERAIRYAIERKQTESALRQSEEKFAAAFENNPTAMAITRLSDGLFTEANRSFCQMVGYRREEIIGQSSIDLKLFSPETGAAVLAQFRADGSVHDQELPIRDRQGAARTVLFSLDPIMASGEASIIATMIEISERKRAEEALRFSEERFNQAFNANPDAMLITRVEDGLIEAANAGFERLLGYSRAELQGKTVWDLGLYVHPQDRAEILRQIEDRHSVRDLEIDLYTKTRAVRSVNASVILLNQIGSRSLLSVFQDVTAQKELLAQNLEQRDLLERLIQSAPAGIAFMQGPQHVYSLVNQEFYTFAAGKGELLGRSVAEIWPEVAEVVLPQYDRVFQTGEPFSMVDAPFVLLRDGVLAENYFTYTHTPIFKADGSIEGVMTLAVETTQAVLSRRQAEAQSARLEAVLQALPVGVWITDSAGQIIGKNAQSDRIWAGDAPLAASVEQYREYLSWDLTTGRKLDTADFPLTRALRSGRPVEPIETRIRRFDGSTGVVLVSAVPVINAEGQQIGAVAINLDITESKLAEQALIESQARLMEFVESTHNNYIALDRQWIITYANPHFGEVMKIDARELIGKNYWDVFPHYRDSDLERNYRQVMQERTPLHYRQPGIYTHNVYDVSIFPTQEGLAVFSIDRTEEHRHQQQVENERARLAAVLQALPAAVWIIDGDGRLVFKNEQANRIWGGSAPAADAAQLFQSYAAWFMESGERVSVDAFPITQALKTGEQGQPVELKIRRFDGSEGTILAIGAPIKDSRGLLTGAVAIHIDISTARQVEADRRASESKYQAIFQSTPFSIILAHLSDGRIVDVNPAWQALFEISREEALGKTAAELGTVLDAAERERGYEEMRKHGHLRNFEMRYRAKSGRVFIASNNAEIIEMEGVRYLLSASEDITQRKQIEEELRQNSAALQKSEEKFAKSFFASPVAMAISTVADGRFLEINESYTHLFGFSSAELIGHTSIELGIFPSQEERNEVIQQFEEKGGFRNFEAQLMTKSGAPIDVLFSAERIEVDGQDCMLSLVINITNRKRSEADLQETAGKLKRSNQELEQFAFIASHDLQEPLRKVVQFGNNLRRQMEICQDEDALNSLERMQNAAARMQNMIAGLLELSRVSSQGGDFKPIQTTQLVKEAISDLEGRIRAAHGRVEVENLPDLQADEMQMRRLFQNLIGNSIKFHRPDTPPVVRVSGRVIRKQGIDLAEVRVSDNGIGIEPQYAQRIFQPFQRLHNRDEFEGTGLGLAICQKIVDRHHGTLEVESAPGEGSTFLIRLPLKAS